MSSIKKGLVDRLYSLLFRGCNSLASRKETVLLDIDNTVNNQQERLLRFTQGGICDYRMANAFRELLRDTPLPGSVQLVGRLSQRFQIIWLTSRSIRTAAVTYYWLRKNGFPVYLLVCAGSLRRKTEFIQIFKEHHSIAFVVDDMKEGYEFGEPRYVIPYKQYLESSGLRVFENLLSTKMEY